MGRWLVAGGRWRVGILREAAPHRSAPRANQVAPGAIQRPGALDRSSRVFENPGMTICGWVKNGVVVLPSRPMSLAPPAVLALDLNPNLRSFTACGFSRRPITNYGNAGSSSAHFPVATTPARLRALHWSPMDDVSPDTPAPLVRDGWRPPRCISSVGSI